MLMSFFDRIKTHHQFCYENWTRCLFVHHFFSLSLCLFFFCFVFLSRRVSRSDRIVKDFCRFDVCNLLLINGSVNERTPSAPISSFSSPLFFFSTSKYMHWREILFHSYPFEWIKKSNKRTNDCRASELHQKIMSTIIIERRRQYCTVSIDYAKMFMGDWDRFNSMRQLFISIRFNFSLSLQKHTYIHTYIHTHTRILIIVVR